MINNPPSTGLKMPDFSINNQFANAQTPLSGGIPNFALTAGAAAASLSLPQFGNQNFGAGSASAGVGGGALNQAAQKLIQAADKLIQAADKLMGKGGVGVAGGGGAPSLGGLGGGGTGIGGFGGLGGGIGGGGGIITGGFAGTGRGANLNGLATQTALSNTNLNSFRGQNLSQYHAAQMGMNNTAMSVLNIANSLDNLPAEIATPLGFNIPNPAFLQAQQQLQQLGANAQQHAGAIQNLQQVQPNIARQYQMQQRMQAAQPFIPAAQQIGSSAISIFSAGLSAEASNQFAQEAFGGLGNTYKSVAMQKTQTQSTAYGSIGGAVVGGALGFVISGFNPLGAAFGASLGGGAGAGLGSLNTSGRNDPTAVYNDKLEQYVRFTENLNMANTVSEVFGAAAANMPVTGGGANRVARDQMHKYAAMSRLYNQLGGSVANLNKLSINYGALGLTNGAISADIGLVGGRIQVDEYRNTLGLTRAEGMQEEINAALGRGSRGGVDSNLIIRGKLSGFTSQQIGFAESYRTAGTGLGGLGLSAKGTLQEANALNLTGQAATDYIGAKYGYLGSLAQRGISVGADFVGGTNQFINTGRNLGLRGFEGKLAFERAQEISGLGNRGAGKIGGIFGGIAEDLLMVEAMGRTGGNLQASYKMLKGLSGADAQSMLGKYGQIGTFAMMGADISPDTIAGVMGIGGKKSLAQKALSEALNAAEGSAAASLAKMDTKLMQSFNQNIFQQITNQEIQIQEAKLQTKILTDIKTLFDDAKTKVPEPVKAYQPAPINVSSPNTPNITSPNVYKGRIR